MDHKEAKPKNIKEQLLLKFYDYLCIILGGGGRKGVARGQNTPYNLSSISVHLHSSCSQPPLIWPVKDGGMAVWRMWAKSLRNKYEKQLGTIKSYVSSLVELCKCVVDQNQHYVENFPTTLPCLV